MPARSRKEWYHTDEHGRRIGYMTPDRFQMLVSGFYNERFWVKLFAEDFGFTETSIYRWINGEVPIRRDTAMLVQMLPKFGSRENLPTIKADYLPVEQEKKPKRPHRKKTEAA